jgi:acylphosphatase
MAELVSLHAIVRGRVQGVYFRDFVRGHAEALGLRGYVRNLPDWHSVEVLAEGKRDDLLQLIEHLKVGPRGAKVEKVDIDWEEYSGSCQHFRVKY